MKKGLLIGLGVLLLGAISSSNSQPSNLDAVQSGNVTSSTKKIKPICDGTTVTSSCTLEGANYKTYIYHPAVAEKSHNETVTTYKEEVTGYCTLCIDGTFSPSCATGRGACSHHGGVAQWNAPITSRVPVETTKTIIDAPAQEAYYEKIAE